MVVFHLIHPLATAEDLGFLPMFFSSEDPRPAKEQIHEAYQHGGGWDAFEGFTLVDKERLIIEFPEDPPLEPIAMAKLRDELIVLYPFAWLAIFQKDGSFEISRVD